MLKKWANRDYQTECLRSIGEAMNRLNPTEEEVQRSRAILGSSDWQTKAKNLTAREQQLFSFAMQYHALISAQSGNFEDTIDKNIKWGTEAQLIMSVNHCVVMPATARILLREDGSLAIRPLISVYGCEYDDAIIKERRDAIYPLLYPALLALSFMHCKNVVLSQGSKNREHDRNRKRAGVRPLIRYHTINIEPMKKVLRTEGALESEGLKKALHICRGHFSTYSEERPLFGKVAGTFWIPAHVRGNIEVGSVLSDFKVKEPAKAT
jgi:hypothetical protein